MSGSPIDGVQHPEQLVRIELIVPGDKAHVTAHQRLQRRVQNVGRRLIHAVVHRGDAKQPGDLHHQQQHAFRINRLANATPALRRRRRGWKYAGQAQQNFELPQVVDLVVHRTYRLVGPAEMAFYIRLARPCPLRFIELGIAQPLTDRMSLCSIIE